MDNHLSLSFELIYLMGWLLKHEKSMLNSLIKHALKNGLAQDLERIHDLHHHHPENNEELYATILEFLTFLEKSLAKNLDNQTSASSITDDTLLPTVNKMTQDTIDLKNIKLNLQKAKDFLQKKIKENKAAATTEEDETVGKEAAKKVLYEGILKNWKPGKNDLVN